NLRKVSKIVDDRQFSSAEFKKFYRNLKFTMVKRDGVGLAAPQVGKNIRLFAMQTKDGPLIFINPKITKKSLTKEWSEEGCLSVPNTFGKVKRHKKITCLYQNDQGERKKIIANGLMAAVLQHENDHLDGILFIDKAREIIKGE
ncbi:MAG: peptide deformylase, partial [Candidatus Falkowbacteria bacterium]|nr:peptide deformylase [Candidatus Falkowbacteria bacterium]